MGSADDTTVKADGPCGNAIKDCSDEGTARYSYED